MSYINTAPSNGLSERFILGGQYGGGYATADSDFPTKGNGVLKKFTSYQLTVTPYNKQGTGVSSNAVVATTLEDGKTLKWNFD